jgi:phosphatidylglycerol:prolipoprotein diacylglycerol transferase
MGGFTLLLWRWRNRWQAGTLIAIYLIGAGLERFLVEFVRRNPDAFLGLTQPQLVSAVMMLAGGAWLVSRRGAVRATATA